MATLPRGVQSQSYRLSDGSTVTKYRVRIVRKDFKADKLFDDLEEAKEFLALSKVKKGKEIIFNITEQERKFKQSETNKSHRFKFGYVVDQYIREYVKAKPAENELQKRNIANTLSFYKTITNTKFNGHTFSLDNIDSFEGTKLYDQIFVPFSDIDIRKIDKRLINLYIRTRLRKVKATSVSRELTHISNIFRKAEHLSRDLEGLENPALLYDKDLLKERSPKKELNISDSEKQRFFELLRLRQDKSLYNICMLSILTSMRRSEVLFLTKSAVKHDHIYLQHTKSGRPRKVYFENERVKKFVDSLPTQPDSDRFFHYKTTTGFDRVFRAFVDRHNFSIRFHDLRRLAITRTILKFGAQNSILITEMLGISNVKRFEENYIDKQTEVIDQNSALKTFGHSDPQTTKRYFNMPQLIYNYRRKK